VKKHRDKSFYLQIIDNINDPQYRAMVGSISQSISVISEEWYADRVQSCIKDIEDDIIIYDIDEVDSVKERILNISDEHIKISHEADFLVIALVQILMKYEEEDVLFDLPPIPFPIYRLN